MKSEAEETVTRAGIFSRCIRKELTPKEGVRIFFEEVVPRCDVRPVVAEESRRRVLGIFWEVGRGETPMMAGGDEIYTALKMQRGW